MTRQAPTGEGDVVVNARLNNKVAIVTGGARGIGAAFCEALAAAGAKLVVVDILDARSVVTRIEALNTSAIHIRTDVTSSDSVDAMVKEALQAFGTVDILVNNAGLFADLPRKP